MGTRQWMSKQRLVCLLMPAISICLAGCADETLKPQLVGTWSTQSGSKAIYEFREDGVAKTTAQATKLVPAHKGKGTWSVDGKTLRISMDFIFANRTPHLDSELTILSVNEEKLELRLEEITTSDGDSVTEKETWVWLKIKSR